MTDAELREVANRYLLADWMRLGRDVLTQDFEDEVQRETMRLKRSRDIFFSTGFHIIPVK